MKARRVKHLDPDAPLADAIERIVRVRLEELGTFIPRALDPAEVEALHDLRIAAKRLRYILELTAPCFGPGAAEGARRARGLQDLLGELHDCDVMLPRVAAHLAGLRAEDARALVELAGTAADLDPALCGQAPRRVAYSGLELLTTYLEARRLLLFSRFSALWEELERERWRERLLAAVAERPAAGERPGSIEPDPPD